MGGHRAGEVASRIAVEAVVEFISETHKGGELTWPFAADPDQSMTANRLAVALRLANKRVHEAGRREPQYAGMGTTVVAALVDTDRIVVAHVGDSRAYRLRHARLQQVTEDDTWLNVMIAAGAARPTDHPMRHALTRGIGMRPELSPTLGEVQLMRGEHWLMCTDGVHGFVDARVLGRALELPSAEAAASQIVRSALNAGTSDNATAVVLYVS
jgi:PPM family protein phosphatase